jgi:hypothetical protein
LTHAVLAKLPEDKAPFQQVNVIPGLQHWPGTDGTEVHSQGQAMKRRARWIAERLADKGYPMNPCLTPRQVERFESRHGVLLPETYRVFLLEVGDGGTGPPCHGVYHLGKVGDERGSKGYWNRLPDRAKPFPCRKGWCWEERDRYRKADRIRHGSLCVGNDGCGAFWHLIVTGVERGHLWQFTDVGIQPTNPRRDFLTWYEDWLDGVKSWWYPPEEK